jgi:hypothetical protein
MAKTVLKKGQTDIEIPTKNRIEFEAVFESTSIVSINCRKLNEFFGDGICLLSFGSSSAAAQTARIDYLPEGKSLYVVVRNNTGASISVKFTSNSETYYNGSTIATITGNSRFAIITHIDGSIYVTYTGQNVPNP